MHVGIAEVLQRGLHFAAVQLPGDTGLPGVLAAPLACALTVKLSLVAVS